MSNRPRDWEPLHDGDPVAGDPHDVARLGRHLRNMADEIDTQARNIKALSTVEHWDSDAGRAFHEVADGAAGRLKKAFDRYDEAAKALGTKVREGESNEYASELHRAQKKADKALLDFREAETDHKLALKKLEKYEGKAPSQDDITERTRLEKKRDDAADRMRAAHGGVAHAKTIRDDAAKAAAKRIKNVVHHDGVHDPGGIMNWLADWADTLSNISAVLSVLAVICAFVPPLQFLAPIFATLAVISSGLALAGHIYDMTARGGKFDLLKLGVDVLGVFPGLGAIKGFKLASKIPGAGRGMKALGAIDGIGHNFFNGIGVKLTNKVFILGAKALGKTYKPRGKGNYITGVIKGVGFANVLHKIYGDQDSAGSSRTTPTPTTGPSPAPNQPSSSSNSPSTPQPAPQVSPKPFHAALAA
ncbi:putative T7SS-secreted protein [Streptomyces sp. 7N604]|uniref:putative T7SS-secreted protein n=1 Tax=Streptomyces sp. 7N604 TaxID=3457415 RepID=UPI003FD1C1E3